MYSHIKKYFFIHIPKNAGTSIATALLKLDPQVKEYDRKHDRYWTITQKYVRQPDKYFKFAVIRNPWERLVSLYLWHKEGKGRRIFESSTDFTDFVMNLNQYLHIGDESIAWRDKYNDQYQWLMKGDKLLVDYLIRFENLQSGFDNVCDKIGLPRTKLPVKHKTNKLHYPEYYNTTTRKIIRDRYIRDIEAFGYEFDS